jgi:hypothetical protein
LGLQWPVSVADHSPPFSAEARNEWSCASTVPLLSKTTTLPFTL